MGQLHDKYEQTCGCSCSKCSAQCSAMPGFCVPGDIDRIARFMGADPNDQTFWECWFDASEPTTFEQDGVTVEAGTIVPKQDDMGRCVFLSTEGRCMIHPVAPFGCSRFSACNPQPEDRAKAKDALTACATSVDYNMTRGWLKMQGHNAASIAERRMHLKARLEE